jgi:Family of unknown function (DUF6460)
MTQTIEPPAPNPRWTNAPPPSGAASDDNALRRFLGGSPASVFVRLFFVSLIVGALLMWLDIRPLDVFRALDRMVQRLWYLGFDAIREIVEYVIAGAVIVVPVWLVARLLSQRPMR